MLALTALVVGACGSGGSQEPATVRLQVATSQGEYPWTGPLLPPQAPVAVPPPAPDAVEEAGDPVSADGAVPSVPGDRAALYGGSLERTLCDRNAMVDTLEGDRSKADAWRGVLEVADIRGYISKLSPVLLRADTRVTLHEYRDNAASPVQAVLETGTIVLVDNRGVPRVRCARGNPLSSPVMTADAELEGRTWPGLNPERLFVVQPAEKPVEELRVVDIMTGGILPVRVGEGKQAPAPPPPPPPIETSTENPQSPSSEERRAQVQEPAPVPEPAPAPAPAAPPPEFVPQPAPAPAPAPEPAPAPPPPAPVRPPAPAPAPPPPPPPPQIQIPIPGAPPVVIPLPF
ncbi:Uncharacterised protein [Rhodococcus coprophilus]|uniref:DUF6777 domain-containing protein n=1 Tax=Rhodococcus coprophilus TaxID=38310 RepID=A0A2X4XB93_9NOCA|nr:Uncharacterised protein [Rhodococcus coprophilus]